MKAKLKQSELIAYAVKDFVDNKIREKGVEFAIQIAPKYNFICNTFVSGTGICETDKSDLVNVGGIFDLPFKDDMYLWRNWSDWIQLLSSEFAEKNNLTLLTVTINGNSEYYYVPLENEE